MNDEVYLLVIAPHPDDPEFAIGGTVAKLTREGKKVVYVICTSGDKGTSDRSIKPEDLARTRREEELAAAGVLGVREVVFLGYPDQGIEETSDFRKDLVRQIRKFKPVVVASADPYRRYTWHRDHRLTGLVAMDAVFPYARDHLSYPELLAEGFEPHKVKEMWFWASEDPNLRFDITDTFNIKLAALRCHRSQVGEVPPEMESRLREWATENARDENYELGEAFHRVEMRP